MQERRHHLSHYLSVYDTAFGHLAGNNSLKSFLGPTSNTKRLTRALVHLDRDTFCFKLFFIQLYFNLQPDKDFIEVLMHMLQV